MPSPPGTFRRDCRISELCPIFDCTLAPVYEEGIPLHFLHERPMLIVVDERGGLRPRTDRHLAVIFEIQRTSELLPHMEKDLALLPTAPFESLYLSLPGDRPDLSLAPTVLAEASTILLSLAEAQTPIRVVAVSHRRWVHGSVILRHFLVAVFDASGDLLWVHPAAAPYGLIRPGFPAAQQARMLGRRSPTWRPEARRLDPQTGLPGWFRFAADQVRTEALDPDLPFVEVMDHQTDMWVRLTLAEDEEQARIKATRELLAGFELFFGAGGLRPEVGPADFA